MKIEKDRVVTIDYKLSTSKGQLIESSVGRGAPLSFIHGRGAMLPGVDAQLEGLQVGDEKEFELDPGEAFGTVEQQQTKVMPKKEFPTEAKLEPGSKFQAKLPTGNLQITLEVLEDLGDGVRVRLIHPYAGKVIRCEVKVVGIRPATPKELQTGAVEAVAATGAPPPPPPSKLQASSPPQELDPTDLEEDDSSGDDKS